MKIAFDLEKDRGDRLKHGVSLAAVGEMDFDAALVIPDFRREYEEARFQVFGPIGGRLHVLAFIMQGGTLRAIALRKANVRETRRYAQGRR